jgi:hypothetical protein
MRSKAKTSPVIRATLAAMRAVDELRDARLEAAADDAERERVQTEYWDVMKPLLTILHEAQFGPPAPVPQGPRLLTRNGKPIAATPAPRTDTNPVYQLKITLQDSTPPIWRRVQVRGNTSLSRLHAILQVVMGWTDSHLHEFVIRDVRYGMADMEWDPLDRPRDERRVRLGQLLAREKDRFVYEYDFGDGWSHDILIEKIMPPEPGLPYPRCIAGKRACPPEDVGGLSGYKHFLTAIRNPQHEEHDELLVWAGGTFDPEAFDSDAVNQSLGRVVR